jgi:hypothetical protein
MNIIKLDRLEEERKNITRVNLGTFKYNKTVY